MNPENLPPITPTASSVPPPTPHSIYDSVVITEGPVSARSTISPSVPRPRRHRYFLYILLILVVFGAGGYVWAYQSGNNVVSDALEKISDAKTSGFDLQIIATGRDIPDFSGDASVRVSGDFDRNDLQHPVGQGTFNADIDFNETNIEVAIDLKLVGDVLYVRAEKLPMAELIGEGIVGTWISFSKEDTGIDFAEYASSTEKSASEDGLLERGIDFGAVSFGRPSIIRDEEGTWVRRYPLVVDKEELARFLVEVLHERFSNDVEAGAIGTAPSDVDIKKTEKSINESLSKISFDDITVDVELFGGDLRSIDMSLQIRPLEDYGETNKVPVVIIDTHIGYRNVGEPILVVAPKDATPASEIMGQRYGGYPVVPAIDGEFQESVVGTSSVLKPNSSIGVARQNAEMAGVKAKLAGIRADAEIYYDQFGNTYIGLCNSDWLWKRFRQYYGEELVLKGCNVSASGQEYAADTSLPDGTYFCIDSGGAAKVEATQLIGTICN